MLSTLGSKAISDGISAYSFCTLHTCKDTISVEGCKQVLEQMETFGMRNTTEKTPDCRDCIPLPKVQQLLSPGLPDVYRLLLKDEGMIHSSKRGPVTTFLKHVAAMK